MDTMKKRIIVSGILVLSFIWIMSFVNASVTVYCEGCFSTCTRGKCNDASYCSGCILYNCKPPGEDPEDYNCQSQ